MEKIIIGLVGTSGSGKSTAAKYLKKKGFSLIELSSFCRKEAKKRKIVKITKKVLQDIGNELRKEYGPSVLTEKAVFELTENKIKKAVIDGIRNLGEIAYLTKQKNFYLLGIIAKTVNRYQRIVKLRGKSYIGSFNNFLKIEKRDSGLGNKLTGLRVRDCLKKTHLVIENNSTVEDFYKQIDNFIKSLKDIR